MTANVITYRGRSAAREVGKALGFSLEQVDKLSKTVSTWHFGEIQRTDRQRSRSELANSGFDAEDLRVQHFMRLYLQIQDLPRHLGQHSGGMVMCQGRLDEVVPLEPASMPGRVVIQWDKEDCADLGIIKVDLLGLGMMAVLEEVIPMIRSMREERSRSRASAAGRSARLQDAQRSRHDRHVPGRKPRADGDAAAPRAEVLLRHRRGGGDHPSRPDRRRDGPSVLRSPPGQGAGRVSASLARADPRAHARRAAVPGAAAAHRHGRRRLHRRRGRGAAPRDGLQALDGADGRDRETPARRA